MSKADEEDEESALAAAGCLRTIATVLQARTSIVPDARMLPKPLCVLIAESALCLTRTAAVRCQSHKSHAHPRPFSLVCLLPWATTRVILRDAGLHEKAGYL